MFDVYRNADERLNVRYDKIKRGDIMTVITATKIMGAKKATRSLLRG